MSEQFIIQGQQPLSGTIPVYGAKNHALKMICAALLSTGETVIENMPMIEDVLRLLEIVENIGGQVKKDEAAHTVHITPPQTFSGVLPAELVARLRASVVLIGPLLGRYGSVTIPHPGGDRIGLRPINFFIEGLRALGATVRQEDDLYHFSAPNGLHGAHIVFPTITVTGTETVLMAALLAEGTTVLENAACEPEVVALGEYCIQQGAQIQGLGTSTITITGGSQLQPGTARIIPDRLEAGTFLLLAAATRSALTITDCNPAHLSVPLTILNQMGVAVDVHETSMTVNSATNTHAAMDIVTHEYPGFPTDLQPPMTVLLTQATGMSTVRETIFESRFDYVQQLNMMGADIHQENQYRIHITGGTSLRGASIASPDIRAGMAFVMAGLVAKGETIIDNVYHIDRGYERIEQRLQHIGAAIQRVQA